MAAPSFNPICDAIRARRVLEFDYSGLHRVVHPYCHGTSSTGFETLRAVQVGGQSNSPPLTTGKLWTVHKMSNLRVLDKTFTPDDPHYQPDDSAMATIHCRI